MCLVDREDRELHLAEQAQEALVREPLGRDVEQLQLAGQQPILDRLRLLERERRVEPRGGDAARRQRVDLILHQRDERRHDEAGAVEHDRGQLVAEALAAAGREDRERRAPGEQRRDDLPLAGTVVGEPEDVAQRGVGSRLECLGRHGATVDEPGPGGPSPRSAASTRATPRA